MGVEFVSLRSRLGSEALRVAARIQLGFVARWLWMFIHSRLAPRHTEFGQQWQAASLIRAS
jgi:hypothetical protein